jgi:hypothetical protein
MVKFPVFAACAFALLLIFGCIGDSTPASCAGVSPSKLPNCIYTNAISDQNPFYCYSLKNATQREICLRDASDPAMKKAYDRSLPSERDSVFGEPAPSQEPSPPPPPPNNIVPAPAVPCDYPNLTAKDSCLKDMASNQSSFATCERIATQSIREHCISEIAQKTKNITACNDLIVEANRNLCNAYSHG